MEEMEQRLETLEHELAQMKQEYDRLAAINEIWNLMSKFEYYHTAGLHTAVADLFARDRSDVWFSLDGIGVFSGPSGIERLFTRFFPLILGPDPKGLMRIHAVTTPVIEVAADGKTAKGIWISPGHETAKAPGEDRPEGTWVWSYLECDFVKEPTGWKIWHYTLHPIFKTPYHVSWVDSSYLPPDGPPLPAEIGPDQENHVWNAYTTDSVRTLNPEPPAPYETF